MHEIRTQTLWDVRDGEEQLLPLDGSNPFDVVDGISNRQVKAGCNLRWSRKNLLAENRRTQAQPAALHVLVDTKCALDKALPELRSNDKRSLTLHGTQLALMHQVADRFADGNPAHPKLIAQLRLRWDR